MTDLSLEVDGDQVAAASMDGVGVLADGEYVSATDRLAEIHGYEAGGDLVGRRWEEYYLVGEDEGGEEPRELLARVRRDGEWRGTATGLGRTGERFPVALSMRSTDHGIVCVVRDGTAAAESDRTAREAESNQRGDGGDHQRGEGERVRQSGDRKRFRQPGEGGQFRQSGDRNLLGEADAGMVDLSARVREMDLPTNESERIPHELRGATHTDEETGERYRVGIARDVTERRERERRLERQRDELDTLIRINELLLEVIQASFGAPSLERVERTVCERLAKSEFYRFAWIGAPEPGSDRIAPRVSAGVDDDYVESITVTTDGTETGRGPGGRAYTTGEVQVSQDVRADPSFAPWREAALERDVRSAAAVPIVHDDTVYGVLAVYATRADGFTEREQETFAVLGEALGFVTTARRTMRLLHAEAVTELEFDLSGSETLLAHLASAVGCSVTLDSPVTTGDGDWVCYLAVTDCEGDVDRFVAAARADDRVRTAERIGTSGSEQFVGLAATSTLLDTVAAVGGKVTGASFGPTSDRVTVEVPESTDVRTVLARLRAVDSGATLAARTDHQRPVTTDTWLGDIHGPAFTDRQREALEAAYRAGYFEWPRESTAEEVAALLDVARPTFQAHLRKAEREVLSAFFDATRSIAERLADPPTD